MKLDYTSTGQTIIVTDDVKSYYLQVVLKVHVVLPLLENSAFHNKAAKELSTFIKFLGE